MGKKAKPKKIEQSLKQLDYYEEWKATGRLPEIMKFIKDCAGKLVTQKEMCKCLGMSEQSFSKMKKKHPEIADAMFKAKYDLKQNLASALYKRAMGMEIVEEEQFVEESGNTSKRKIHKTTKHVPPDYKSILYLLVKNFGKEYLERFEEMNLMDKKIEQAREEWLNEQQQPESETTDDSDEDDIRVENI